MAVAGNPHTAGAGANWLDRVPPRWVLLCLLLAALVVRGRFMLANADQLLRDPDAYANVGWNIARRHTIAMWSDELGGPVATASRAVLYPIVLAAFDALPVATDPYGVGWLHVVLGAGTAWCAWRLGQQWGLAPGTSLVAAGLLTVDPILLGQSVLIMTESLAALLAGLTLLALGRAGRTASAWRAALAGALLGLCTLCRPTFLAWAALAIAGLAWRAAEGRRLQRTVALVGGLALVLSPWGLRNARVFGRPIVTTTHGGYTLLVANNPGYYEFLRSAPVGSVWDAREVLAAWNAKRVEHAAPDGAWVDEVSVDRWAYEQAWRNIRQEPLMFAWSCLARWERLWGVAPRQVNPHESAARRGLRYAIGLGYAMELALAAVGAWFLGRQMWGPPWIWGSMLVASFMAVHAVFWTDLRMRAPLTVVIVLLAAQGAVGLASPRHRSTRLPAAT